MLFCGNLANHLTLIENLENSLQLCRWAMRTLHNSESCNFSWLAETSDRMSSIRVSGGSLFGWNTNNKQTTSNGKWKWLWNRRNRSFDDVVRRFIFDLSRQQRWNFFQCNEQRGGNHEDPMIGRMNAPEIRRKNSNYQKISKSAGNAKSINLFLAIKIQFQLITFS